MGPSPPRLPHSVLVGKLRKQRYRMLLAALAVVTWTTPACAQSMVVQNAAGVRLLVEDENTQPSLRIILPGHAETDGAIEVVTLRPSIVFGPRSQWWTAQIATDLLSGKAYLIDGGAGICNSVYVDNLVQAMWQAATSSGVANQDFLITDGERVTWWDLYSAIAEAVGVDMATVSVIKSDIVAELSRVARRKELMQKVAANQFARAARQIVPFRVAEAIKHQWGITQLPALNLTSAEHKTQVLRSIDLEIASLQQCHYAFPIGKAQELLGYTPQVTFSEGCRRTTEWLRFAFGMSQDW